MRIALIAPPFIPVPPVRYGGTELFIAHLAEGLRQSGHEVVVYANGESKVQAEVRWIYPKSEWPLSGPNEAAMKDMTHAAWACRDAIDSADLIHVNCVSGVVFAPFTTTPFVATLHHPHEAELSHVYEHFPGVTYVAISLSQQSLEKMPRLTTVHHGLDLQRYPVKTRKEGYLAFLGRIAPMKGPHLAIEIARRAGIPLKIAGEIQPMFREYWESQVKPFVDGRFIEYVGEADHEAKTELLGNASAFLFPIQWAEPFGLVMIEAMACGTPVLAFGGGSVPEIVENGVSGWICRDLDEMTARALDVGISPESCRTYAEQHFSVRRMVQRYEAVYRAALAKTVPARNVATSGRMTVDARVPAAPSHSSLPSPFPGSLRTRSSN